MPGEKSKSHYNTPIVIALAVWLATALGLPGETRLEAEEIAKKKATVEKAVALEEGKRAATAEKAEMEEATRHEVKAAAESKESAIKETKKEVTAAKEEATMADESTTKDSLPDKNAVAPDQDDCGLDFAQAKKESARKPETRGELAVLSGFTLKFKGEVSPFSLMTTTVLPEEEISIEVASVKEADVINVSSGEGKVTKVSPRKWRWKAPLQPGPYCVSVARENSADKACLQAFVMVKYNGEETLNGYPIGKYPDSTTQTTDPVKMRPVGFIEVTKANEDTWVSPHFQLKQFLCKGYEEYPKYVMVRTRLLLKLEELVEDCKAAGIDVQSLYVMSGFRTPAYNIKIGNKTTLSRHTFGDAADVYVDEDRDGMIDDLNKDGKIDTEDARVLHELVAHASKEGWRKPLDGGLSLYPAKPGRSAFIHVDARGTDIHWDGL